VNAAKKNGKRETPGQNLAVWAKSGFSFFCFAPGGWGRETRETGEGRGRGLYLAPQARVSPYVAPKQGRALLIGAGGGGVG